MITVENYSFSYSDSKNPTFTPLSLSIDIGDVLLLRGSTGSGKSTLLKSINGLIPHHCGGSFSGTIKVDGRDVAHVKPSHLARKIGYVPQNPFYGFVTDSVEDEIAFSLEAHGYPRKAMEERVEELLAEFGLAHLRERSPFKLSTGEAQKLSIAAAVAVAPDYLLLDEPTSALDHKTTREVLEFIQEFSARGGVVIAEHRFSAVQSIATAERVLGDDRDSLHPLTKLHNATVIVGDNGSGKTTYLEKYVYQNSSTVGFVPQNPSDVLLTQSIESECALTGGSRAQDIFHTLAPEISLDTHPRDLSEGQKFILALAQAMGNNPSELVLDEPTRGLDIALKTRVFGYLSQLTIPIIIATHDDDLIAQLGATVKRIESLR